MVGSPKKSSFQKRVLKEIEHQTGACNFIIVPEAARWLCDDRDIALMLSYLMYWCDRSSNSDGFIWKSYREWKKETGLNRYQVDKATEWLKGKGFMETQKRMAKGHPTLHYKLNQVELLDAITSACRNRQKDSPKSAGFICRNGRVPFVEMSESIAEI
jgi:hypothetical protein